MNIIIKTTNLELKENIEEEVKEYAEKKFEKLEKYFDKILEIRIELERMQSGHHKKGNVYRAEANAHVPKEILRVEKTSSTITKAIDKAEDHLREIIKEYKDKMSYR